MSKHRKTLGEIVRFAIVGGGATVLHYALYLGLLKVLPGSEAMSNAAYAAGYIIAFVFNFYATSLFTFRVRPTWKKFAGISGAHLVNFLLHMLLFNLFLQIGIPEAWVPQPVYAIAIPLNFLLVRFVFRSPGTGGQA